ncbi:MAG TPA: hypothetical protein VFD93_12160, partial [Candidatus Acidoferrales bacterium]|nr:hypothetical protein [Candidatus Acidoferrales bacterium]
HPFRAKHLFQRPAVRPGVDLASDARQASKGFLVQELYQPLANKALQIPGVIRIASINERAELNRVLVA